MHGHSADQLAQGPPVVVGPDTPQPHQLNASLPLEGIVEVTAGSGGGPGYAVSALRHARRSHPRQLAPGPEVIDDVRGRLSLSQVQVRLGPNEGQLVGMEDGDVGVPVVPRGHPVLRVPHVGVVREVVQPAGVREDVVVAELEVLDAEVHVLAFVHRITLGVDPPVCRLDDELPSLAHRRLQPLLPPARRVARTQQPEIGPPREAARSGDAEAVQGVVPLPGGRPDAERLSDAPVQVE